MKKLIFFFFLIAEILIFQSCLTVGRIQRNCDKFTKVCTAGTETKIVYRDTTIYRSDTIQIFLPADTVKITDTVRIENNQAILKPVSKQFGLIGVNAWINKNILNVNAWLRDSTILVPYRDTIILHDAIQQATTTNTIIQKQKYIPGFYRYTFWLFWSVLGVIVLWFVIRNYGAKILSLITKAFI